MAIDYSRYITQDPKICGGEPVVRGTRVPVRTVLASLAEGATVPEVLEDFPTLDEESVKAITSFAARTMKGHLLNPDLPSASS